MLSTDDRATLTDGVSCEPYAEGAGLPMFVEPTDDRLRTDPTVFDEWFQSHRAEIDALTTDAGAVVFRGFPVTGTGVFDRLVRDYGAGEFGYTAGATPRSPIEGRVYEATHAPPSQRLMLHQEMAYLPAFPQRLGFYCHHAPDKGGETIIGDMRRFTAAVSPELFARVQERGVRYTRNFRDPQRSMGTALLDTVHRPWTEALTTTDRAEAEAACAAMGLTWEWVQGGISVSYTAPGWITHPRTGQVLWFNHMASQTLSVENVGAELAAQYRTYYTDHPLPYNTSYGDGSPIDGDDLASLYRIFDSVTVAFPWRDGDVMLVDNFNTAHGRNPYEGHRDVQVALLD